MHLNEAEKRMLAGKNGKACELAMNILSDLGDLYGAERMIAVSQVHIDMTLYMVDAGVEFAERMADLRGEFAVPAQLNPASIDLIHHEKMRVPRDLLENSRRLESAFLKMGAIPTWTCAPYQQGLIPSFGDQVAWGESNAVAFVNSVIGGGEFVNRVGGSVIGILHDDAARVSGMRLGQTPGEIVGFASRAHEHADRKITGHGCGESIRVLDNGLIQIARVGVQCRRLPGQRLHDGGMTMSD